LRVRPGLTGLAQVQLPPDTDLESVRRKLACDLYYVERLSLWLDVRILLSTPFHVVGIPFAVARTLFRVPSGEAVHQAYEGGAAPRAGSPATPAGMQRASPADATGPAGGPPPRHPVPGAPGPLPPRQGGPHPGLPHPPLPVRAGAGPPRLPGR